MAHWAQVENDKVINVVVTDNNDPAGDEGYQWLIDNFGGTWIQTSYNAKIRGKFAGIGDAYDSTLDRFIAAKPFASWKLDKNSNWQAPKPYPPDGKDYDWNENQKDWVDVV